MKKLFSLLGTLLCLAALANPAAAKEYEVDTGHSSIVFSVTHLQLSEVDGRFKDFEGVIDWDPDKLAATKIDWTVQVASITTDNERRDKHLRGADFFDADQYKTMTFKSTAVSKLSKDKYKVTGDLTMHGVTKSVTMTANIRGPVDTQDDGELSIGYRTTFKINRMDWGVGAGWKGNSDSVVSHAVFVTIKGEAHE